MAEAIHYFPKGFKWGTATSAHQVEGHNNNNQWWAWEQSPGHVKNGDKSGVACDWWRNAETDFDLMVEMGLNAHRLSVEWSRIEPREGVFDSAAVDRYRAMLLALRQRGIEPMVTLHHFTNPLWLDEQGGWEETDVVVPRFERFVAHVVKALGDLCDLWCTINEPNIYAGLGYLVDGSMPPGRTGELSQCFAVVRNMLLGHAAAYRALHHHQRLARVGIAHHMTYLHPLRVKHPLDRLVARIQDGIFNRSILDALIHGRWHPMMLPGAPSARPLRGTLDWIGLNYYMRQCTTCDHNSPATLFSKLVSIPDAVMSDFGFGEIYPDGLLPLLRYLARFKLPIYITENGLPDADDDQRPEFIVRHLRALWTAAQFNYQIKGYYHWSFVDNFEWAEGWRMKFGLYEMDPVTQARAPRRSAMLYRDIVQANALSSTIVCEHTPALMPALFP
ncbi:MAG: glycoside hydrolase family 1 protein [Chloroflexi bacterium]|nr:glycoside hydrolase family 1 protein [Chloroflexota bacterium]